MYERKVNNSDNDIFYDEEKRCVSRTDSFIDCVAQKIKTLIQTFQGECFTDKNAGVEWYDKILGQNILALDAAKAELKEKILSVSEVKELKKISIIAEGRNTKCDYTVILNDGTELKDYVYV